MQRIQKLDALLIAQIAAGEVIESPAAIVKELVENSLDAGATEIEILIEGDGFVEIQVRDNGVGIAAADLPLAVESFATSKIRSFDDLIAADSMGFRGEALGSIAAVSRLTLESRPATGDAGAGIRVSDGAHEEFASPIEQGTRAIVRDLFHNVPVRRDYYQYAPRIRRQMHDVLLGLCVANCTTAFRYQLGSDAPVVLPARKTLIERMGDVWGETISADLLPLYAEADGLRIEGYISKFYFYRTHAADMRLWVNRRPVVYKPLTMLLRHAYGELMPKGRFPFASLFLYLPPQKVDVNVHPQKREIRFKDDTALQNFLREAFRRTIAAEGGIAASSMVRQSSPQVVRQSSAEVFGQNLSNALESTPQQAIRTPIIADRTQSKPSETGQANTVPSSVSLFTPELSISASGAVAAEFPEDLVLHARLFNTFIVGTAADGLYLVDQHTAHERINYENFLSLLAKRQEVAQKLLHPLPLQNNIFASDEITPLAAQLRSVGFAVEDFGPAGLALTHVPFYVEAGEEIAAFTSAVAAVHDVASTGEALFDQIAKDLSCRHAIRKGESASLSDFRELLARLRQCTYPLRCPHGRPTIIRIDEKEVFAYFKRQK
ncbi:MAG: DNA mismatch repair endonuclease MutL [Spirochaetes bacterium]|nr:DNA mismatch repair endonuclease MutL [Spirochaetota bacterium]